MKPTNHTDRTNRLVLFVLFVGLICLIAATPSPPPVIFTDIAQKAGLTDKFYCGDDKRKLYIIETLGGGVALFDYNQDGYPDAFFVTGTTVAGFPPGQEPSNQLYRNNKDGTFTNVTREAGLWRTGWGQGVCVGDYDRDGLDDLFVTYWGENVLYRNLGNGRFADVTAQAGLKNSRKRWGTGCAFLDYDRDGNLDLFVANYVDLDLKTVPTDCKWRGIQSMCGPRGLKGETNQLWHNQGDGTFVDVSEKAGITTPDNIYGLSVTTFDYDGDGWTDIYVAVDSKSSILYHNNHDGTFTDVALESGAALDQNGNGQAGMGTAAGDFDGDGLQDLYKTNFIADTCNLYRNQGDGTFVDYIVRANLGRHMDLMGWGAAFLDFDNDSWLDVLRVNGHIYPEIEAVYPDEPYRQPKLLYRNLGNGRFEDVSSSSGPGVTARSSARGLAVGDFDDDGDVDAFVNNMNDRPNLLLNEGGNRANFISIKLVGTRANTDGYGSIVKLTAGGRTQIQEARSGSSFMSNNDPRLHFGLGTAAKVDSIEVRWLGGTPEIIKDVPANQFITIRQGAGIVRSEAR